MKCRICGTFRAYEDGLCSSEECAWTALKQRAEKAESEIEKYVDQAARDIHTIRSQEVEIKRLRRLCGDLAEACELNQYDDFALIRYVRDHADEFEAAGRGEGKA